MWILSIYKALNMKNNPVYNSPTLQRVIYRDNQSRSSTSFSKPTTFCLLDIIES